jgi:tagatose 1,6-diphosphate aldolase GatY/KbaY
MGLSSPLPWLQRARQEGWAVPGFAAYNLETVKALVATADRLRTPVLVQTTWSTIEHAGLRYLARLVELAASEASVPVALHLDHGRTLDQVKQCLEAGYTSVMLDASRMPYADNVKWVREAVRMAHERGVPVEAELGRIGGVEDASVADGHHVDYTDPEMAAAFVQETGCDTLAVAIGTAHGLYREPPSLDFERLTALRAAVPVPLVMHGASGVPDDDVKTAVRLGMAKVNFASELKAAFGSALRTYLSTHPEANDPREYFPAAVQAYVAVIAEKVGLVGSAGRADG